MHPTTKIAILRDDSYVYLNFKMSLIDLFIQTEFPAAAEKNE